jgi:drug/metabolite transporter (DMT)-like permease
MIGATLALAAALTYSLSIVLIKKRLDESKSLNVALVTAITGNIVLWPLAILFTDLTKVSFEGVLFFAVAGMLAPGFMRLLYFKGMKVLGSSVNAAIYAIYPIYSSILAVLFLSKSLSVLDRIGIACVVTGAVFIERYLGETKTAKRTF